MFYKNLTKWIVGILCQWFIISFFIKSGIIITSWFYVFLPIFILLFFFILGYVSNKIIDWHRKYLINRSYDILLADNEKDRIKIHKEYIEMINKKISKEQTN